MCQGQIKLKVESRFVRKSVEIEAERILKSRILYCRGLMGGVGKLR